MQGSVYGSDTPNPFLRKPNHKVEPVSKDHAVTQGKLVCFGYSNVKRRRIVSM